MFALELAMGFFVGFGLLKRDQLGLGQNAAFRPISNFVRGVIWMEWKDPSIWQ